MPTPTRDVDIPTPHERVSQIPLELRQQRRWVLWRYETRGDKRTKVPYTINGRLAKSTDPKTWNTLGACLRYQGGYDGIGYVLGDGYAGVDMDNCVTDGQLNEQSQAMTRWLNSYAEISPSGNGIKVIVKATVPSGKKLPSIEIYGGGRYFTITGDKLPHAPATVNPADLSGLLTDPEPIEGTHTGEGLTATDDEVLAKAFAARNGHKVQQLYGGDTSGYPSRSEADLALSSMLAFWVGRNPQQLERLLRNSGLYRDKWQQRYADGTTYLGNTIQRALSRDTFYSGKAEGGTGLSMYLNLLDPVLPFWKGRRGLTARNAYAQLLDIARHHHTEADKGIVVSLSYRDWALRAGVSKPTLCKTIKHLERHALIQRIHAPGCNSWLIMRGGTFFTHSQPLDTTAFTVVPEWVKNVPLREGGGRAPLRAGRLGEAIIWALVMRPLTARELAEETGRRVQSIRRKLKQLQDVWNVTQRLENHRWRLRVNPHLAIGVIGHMDGSSSAYVRDRRKYEAERSDRAAKGLPAGRGKEPA